MPTGNPQSSTQDVSAVHALIVSLPDVSVMVPSAMVAEVLQTAQIQAAPDTRPWVLGRILWRGISVPVFSLAALFCDRAAEHDQHARVVVFYPLPGRGPRDFFSIVTHRDPRSMLVQDDLNTCPVPTGVSGRYVASSVQLEDRIAVIPDLDALATAIY